MILCTTSNVIVQLPVGCVRCWSYRHLNCDMNMYRYLSEMLKCVSCSYLIRKLKFCLLVDCYGRTAVCIPILLKIKWRELGFTRIRRFSFWYGHGYISILFHVFLVLFEDIELWAFLRALNTEFWFRFSDMFRHWGNRAPGEEKWPGHISSTPRHGWNISHQETRFF